MEHCSACNATLKVGEKECWGCSAVVPEKQGTTNLHQRFHSVINVLFIIFAVLTPLSLVLPDEYVPPFKKCAAGLVVIVLARSSIQAMSDARKR
jgi:hypothetical protein